MKAMILAAGMGSRLAHITKETPKCLVDVGGKPIIYHVISSLSEAGIKDFVVNLHYKADQVHEYLESLQSETVRIQYSREENLLDTGGGLKTARAYFDDCDLILIHNADIYTEVSFERMIQFHRDSDALVTLYTRQTSDMRTLLFSRDGRLLGWQNRATKEERVVSDDARYSALGFCGVSLISKGFFDYLDGFGEKFSLISGFLSAVEAGRKVLSFEDNESYWIDMGTPEKLMMLRERLQQR